MASTLRVPRHRLDTQRSREPPIAASPEDRRLHRYIFGVDQVTFMSSRGTPDGCRSALPKLLGSCNGTLPFEGNNSDFMQTTWCFHVCKAGLAGLVCCLQSCGVTYLSISSTVSAMVRLLASNPLLRLRFTLALEQQHRSLLIMADTTAFMREQAAS